MSSISSVGGGGLFQYFQNITGTSQSQATTPSSTTSTNTTASTDPTASGQVQGHHHHRHHGGGGGDKDQLFSQIQQAVSGALQSAQQGGTNPNQAIQDAISKVFQNNTAATSQTANGTTPAGGDPNAPSANTPASTTDNNASSSLQAFFQTLQSAGIDPQQFHQDLLSAVQNAQNGNVNPGTAFQSVPPGSLIDAIG